MTLLRALHAELLKLKRTMALKMVVLAPGIVVLLLLFVASQAPFSTVRRNAAGGEWMGLAYTHLLFWTVLMLPLFITLEAALVAGLDHAENQWKSLFARPVPRWAWPFSTPGRGAQGFRCEPYSGARRIALCPM